MSIISTLEWIESTDLSTAIRGHAALSDHRRGPPAGNCAVWGDAPGNRSPAARARDAAARGLRHRPAVAPLEAVGLPGGDGQRAAANLGGSDEAVRSPSFRFKMMLFALVGLHALALGAGR